MTVNNNKDKKQPGYQMGLRSKAWKQTFGDQKQEKVSKDQAKDCNDANDKGKE
jgi:hypothetical protein